MPIHAFGDLPDGRAISQIRLAKGEMQVAVLTLGAILQDVRLGGGAGLTAGSPELAAYADGPLAYAGAIVGPVANRIGGAQARLGGDVLRFEANAGGGHHLHGGATGLHQQNWEIVEHSAEAVTLDCDLPHGLGGYPGARHATARYALAPAGLSLEITATTDRDTLWAPANHSYWTLGTAADDHRLQVLAEQILVADENVLPTGELADVSGTRFDFREARDLSADDVLDTAFCLSQEDRPCRPVARLTGGGIVLEMATTAPGLQVFTADPFGAPGVPGHEGRRYGPRFGVALEAQGWPDAPNQPHFPSMVLRPEETWHQRTEWRITSR